MILTIRADQPKQLLASILESVIGGQLNNIHKAVNGDDRTEQNRKWSKGKENFLLLIGSDPSDSALKMNYKFAGERRLIFEFEHDGEYSPEEFSKFHKDLVIYLLHYHPDEFEEISLVNRNT